MNKNIIFDKEGFILIKTEENSYNAKYLVENKNIILPNIIDFNLIKLIYELNNDIYEKVDIKIINDNEAICIFLIKHFFEDIGLPQKYSHMLIKKYVEKDSITFISQTIETANKPEYIPKDATLVKMQRMICKCNIVTQNQIEFNISIHFVNNLEMPTYVEKIIGAIIFKIFIRVKQFIENVRI